VAALHHFPQAKRVMSIQGGGNYACINLKDGLHWEGQAWKISGTPCHRLRVLTYYDEILSFHKMIPSANMPLGKGFSFTNSGICFFASSNVIFSNQTLSARPNVSVDIAFETDGPFLKKQFHTFSATELLFPALIENFQNIAASCASINLQISFHVYLSPLSYGYCLANYSISGLLMTTD
jgi:hypothetical protein